MLRKLIIVAAVDGLILQAHGVDGPRHSNGSDNETSSIWIDYRTSKVTALPTLASKTVEGQETLEAYGLVGKAPNTKTREYRSKR